MSRLFRKTDRQVMWATHRKILAVVDELETAGKRASRSAIVFHSGISNTTAGKYLADLVEWNKLTRPEAGGYKSVQNLPCDARDFVTCVEERSIIRPLTKADLMVSRARTRRAVA